MTQSETARRLQRHRWLATALIEIELRLRKVKGYRHLPRLRDAIKQAVRIEENRSSEKAALISQPDPSRFSTKKGLASGITRVV